MAEKQFWFEGLEIWKKAADFSDKLFALADGLEERKLTPH
jgi:hypothetical protein